MSQERALDLLHELEWRRCAEDPVYFVSQFCWIQHPEGPRLIPMRDVQREILGVWATNQATVSLKARQIGWSTIASLYSLWVAMYGDGRRVILLSRGQEFARDVLGMATFAYDRLPDWMRDRCPTKGRTMEKLTFANASRIESLPSKVDPARGKTAHTMFADEFAFFDDPESQWPSLLPVVDVGGSLHILSSANGAGTFFEKLYVDGKEGHNKFRSMFYSWRCVPERDDNWYEGQKQNLSEWQLHQEYPADDVEAFIRSGHPVFSADLLKGNDQIHPDEGELLEGIFFPFESGPLELFQEPDLNAAYVIGADTARGLSHGDYCCAVVLKIPATTSEPLTHVASYHAQSEPDRFGEELNELGRWYNEALLGVENNSHGLTTLVTLRDLAYPNLFYRRVVGKKKDTRTREMGWATTRTTKPLMIDELGGALRERSLIVRCPATVRELMAYRRGSGGEMSGAPHDDRVIAAAVAVQMVKHTKARSRSVEDEGPAPFTGQWLLDNAKALAESKEPKRVSWLQDMRK